MFKKNEKQTETIKEPKEKKVRTVKVGTHKKTVIALWVVLIASVSFGVYKNFTAIDQHTTHEVALLEEYPFDSLLSLGVILLDNSVELLLIGNNNSSSSELNSFSFKQEMIFLLDSAFS